MNINDIKNTEEIPENIWQAIFDKQWELAVKYKDIEIMGDLLETLKTNIDTRKGQKWIKDFAWRVTEELTEADESVDLFDEEQGGDGSDWKESQHRIHYLEEVTDALHFFAEMALICGYKAKDFVLWANESNDASSSYDVIYNLGLACNCLKNKPWKQTQMLTDRPKFFGYMSKAFNCLINLYDVEGLNEKDIYQYYFKKNAVNKFRIRSKY